MAVMVPRETVNEHRLDALEKKVDEGFRQMDERFSRLEDRMMRLEDGFFALNRTLSIGAVAIVATLVGSNFF